MQVRLVQQALQDPKAQRALKVRQALLGLKDHKVTLVSPAQRETKEQLALPDHRV
jgi:hypothetical protein